MTAESDFGSCVSVSTASFITLVDGVILNRSNSQGLESISVPFDVNSATLGGCQSSMVRIPSAQ